MGRDGSLTFEALKFPIASGSVPVKVDIILDESMPPYAYFFKVMAKVTAKDGDDLFCIEADSSCHDGCRGEGGACGPASRPWEDPYCCPGLTCSVSPTVEWACMPCTSSKNDTAVANVEDFVEGG